MLISEKDTIGEVPQFTSSEIYLYERRLEEGYDIPDKRYKLWLAAKRNLDSPSHLDQSPYDQLTDATATSSCQVRKCSHPKARHWIGCDICRCVLVTVASIATSFLNVFI